MLNGVPQESILGPLFLNIFIKNLFFLTEVCNLADECSPNLPKLTKCMEEDMAEVEHWSNFTFFEGMEQGEPNKSFIL